MWIGRCVSRLLSIACKPMRQTAAFPSGDKSWQREVARRSDRALLDGRVWRHRHGECCASNQSRCGRRGFEFFFQKFLLLAVEPFARNSVGNNCVTMVELRHVRFLTTILISKKKKLTDRTGLLRRVGRRWVRVCRTTMATTRSRPLAARGEFFLSLSLSV